MTTGCGRCRRHPGSKKRPWNVEPASADALRPGPPARLAKASLRKMRPAAVRLEVTGCNAWAGWPDLPWPGAIRADAAGGVRGGCADSWGCRPGRSRNAGWARLGSPRPPTRFSGVGATTVRSFGPCPCRPRRGAGPPEGRASCCGATRCAGGAVRGAAVTRGVAARGACGATRGAAMCGAAARAAGAACGAGAAAVRRGAGAGAGCAAGGAPGGFAVAEVAAMPAARTRSAALRMLDCNMIPAPASSSRVFRVNVGTGWWLRVRRCRGLIARGQSMTIRSELRRESEQIDTRYSVRARAYGQRAGSIDSCHV